MDISIYDKQGGLICAVVVRVVDRVTGLLPPADFELLHPDWSYIRSLSLADPWFNRAAPVELLLDASVFADSVGSIVHHGPHGSL